MTILEQMRAVAETENRAARQTWDKLPGSPLTHLVERYVGTGMTQREVANRIGAARASVGNILRENGWTL